MTVDELKAALQTANDSLAAIGPEVDKIGTETTGSLAMIADLKKQIADLINNGVQIPQEVVDLVTSIQNTTASIQSKVKTVDDLVPDAP